jgi:hypothetical protein
MSRRRSKQLQLALRRQIEPSLPLEKERELIDALAELLLTVAAVPEGSSAEDEERVEDERQDQD